MHENTLYASYKKSNMRQDQSTLKCYVSRTLTYFSIEEVLLAIMHTSFHGKRTYYDLRGKPY